MKQGWELAWRRFRFASTGLRLEAFQDRPNQGLDPIWFLPGQPPHSAAEGLLIWCDDPDRIFKSMRQASATQPAPRLYPDTVIYVLCPAHIVTGGIEAVHQLVDQLHKFGHRATIVTLPLVDNPTLLQYRNYEVEFTDSIIDSSRNILITTEVNPSKLDPYHHIQKALWWLSVDNHENLTEKFDFARPENQSVIHFAQSAYAVWFLKQKGINNVYYLTDYLHAEYLRKSHQIKTNVVLYTPVKGSDHYVKQLIEADPSIQWLPLTGMIRKMHAQTLRKGKVYVDFGSHPGRDRQPREAAVNGCCVVCGLRGSACFDEDLPIPATYKFAVEALDKDSILSTIRHCLFDYEHRTQDFESYRTMVRQEKTRFGQEVAGIFGIKSISRKPHQLIIAGNLLKFIRQHDSLTVLRGLANELLPLPITNTARRIYREISTTLSKNPF